LYSGQLIANWATPRIRICQQTECILSTQTHHRDTLAMLLKLYHLSVIFMMFDIKRQTAYLTNTISYFQYNYVTDNKCIQSKKDLVELVQSTICPLSYTGHHKLFPITENALPLCPTNSQRSSFVQKSCRTEHDSILDKFLVNLYKKVTSSSGQTCKFLVQVALYTVIRKKSGST